MSITIELNNLTKSYGNSHALRNMNLRIEGNKIIGLLGRNGSGKTSLLSILAGLRRPTSGIALIDEESPFENARLARMICFARDSRIAYPGMKVRQALELASLSWPNWDDAYAQSLAAKFELPLGKKVQALSRGMESSLSAVIGLASRAPVTLLDETYLGMDAAVRHTFYEELLEDFMRFPRLMIVSTHLIEEVGRMFEEVIIIDQGSALLHEETDILLSRAFTVIGEAPDVERFTAEMRILHTRKLGGKKSVLVYGELDAEQELLAEQYLLSIGPVTLQELVVHLTGKEAASQ